MKITTRGRYGLRALIDLCLNSTDGKRVALADISSRQDLSLNYLESIFSILKRGGLVNGAAGAQGGYLLAKPPQKITLLECLTLLEGTLSVHEEDGGESTPLKRFLKGRVWDEIDRSVDNALCSTTIAEIAAEVQEKTNLRQP